MASRTLRRAIAAPVAAALVVCGRTSCFLASIRGTAEGLSFGVQTGCLS
ncbi:hypothetical protein [Frigoribacterium sp. PhB24]|nr:hypothetical protein [Frigoribacterium sp. PhB24]ROS49448.1 hypothetical protein EDF50_2361 [Frigoribacterium sp. PhB24]